MLELFSIENCCHCPIVYDYLLGSRMRYFGTHQTIFFIGLYERNYLHTPRSTECFTWITHVSFFICNSIAIDFGIDYSLVSSKALRPFHLTEVTKLFNRFASQRLLSTHGKIHFNETLGLDKLIEISDTQAFVVISGRSAWL